MFDTTPADSPQARFLAIAAVTGVAGQPDGRVTLGVRTSGGSAATVANIPPEIAQRIAVLYDVPLILHGVAPAVPITGQERVIDGGALAAAGALDVSFVDWAGFLANASAIQLESERAWLNARAERHSGRETADASAECDWCDDLIEEIDAALARRVPALPVR